MRHRSSLITDSDPRRDCQSAIRDPQSAIAMSVHLDRARLLLAQSRPADAERETMLALAQQPDSPQALALLALSRIEQDKRKEALEAAREAVGLAPDQPFLHYVHAHVLRNADRSRRRVSRRTGSAAAGPGGR
jgi:predicted Zn-dependent protease